MEKLGPGSFLSGILVPIEKNLNVFNPNCSMGCSGSRENPFP
jgi:hypothetical protein